MIDKCVDCGSSDIYKVQLKVENAESIETLNKGSKPLEELPEIIDSYFCKKCNTFVSIL